MSRLATIGDGTNTYATYKYLGAGRIVVEDYEDIDVKLDYAADNFAALDRFGRVVDQVWTDYGANPDVTLDEYTYTYDRAGNRTSRDNELHSAFDEDYTYDDLDRLTSSDAGRRLRPDRGASTAWATSAPSTTTALRRPAPPTRPTRSPASPAAGSRPTTTPRAT